MREVPVGQITPELPPYLNFPFHYASLQCQWVFWEVPLDAAQAALGRAAAFDTGLEVVPFTTAGGGRTAGAVINFQRYTAHLPNALATTNEIEFNLLCRPRSAPLTPSLSLADYMHGLDQTGTVGQLRLHVGADNAFAVEAGKVGFGENKFFAKFLYTAPTLNDPHGGGTWRTRLYDPALIVEKDGMDAAAPGADNDFVYALDADLAGLTTVPVATTPLTEFALGLGRTVVTRWTLLGAFQSVILGEGDAGRVRFTLGPDRAAAPEACKALRVDLAGLIAGRPAFGVQTFDPAPVCFEPPGYFLDAQGSSPRRGAVDEKGQFSAFLDTSARLTGYDHAALMATGCAQAHWTLLRAEAPSDQLAALLGGDDKGPLAKALIRLWYLGLWTGADRAERVASPRAYREALVWDAIGAHPMGAKQQGFGAWATRPPGACDA